MKRAFHSVRAPKNFKVQVAEHSDNGTLLFLEIIADEFQFINMNHEQKIEAVRYLFAVRDALMDQGTVVQITRRAVE